MSFLNWRSHVELQAHKFAQVGCCACCLCVGAGKTDKEPHMLNIVPVLFVCILISSKISLLAGFLQENLFKSHVFSIQPKKWFSFVEKIIATRWQNGNISIYCYTRIEFIAYQSLRKLLQIICPVIDNKQSTSVIQGFPVTFVTSPMGILSKREQGEDRETFSPG